MDLVVRCALLPKPSETIIADSACEIPGGKGANQAVASARAGGDVTMIGRVGDDAFASRLVDNLCGENIGVDFVSVTKDCASGIAVVAVESSGENAIMVVPGANGRVTAEDVESAADVIRAADVLLLQLEIPLESAIASTSIAAAGDAFAGALAVRLAEGASLSHAARFAAAAGAIAATHLGAQPGMPTRNEIEQLLRQTSH